MTASAKPETNQVIDPAKPPATPIAPPCGAPTAPPLDYRDIQIGATYHVDVSKNGDEWTPAANIPMPMHHATRIAWQNPDQITKALGPAASGRQRFTFTVDAREIQQVPDRREWRVTVRATITAICAP